MPRLGKILFVWVFQIYWCCDRWIISCLIWSLLCIVECGWSFWVKSLICPYTILLGSKISHQVTGKKPLWNFLDDPAIPVDTFFWHVSRKVVLWRKGCRFERKQKMYKISTSWWSAADGPVEYSTKMLIRTIWWSADKKLSMSQKGGKGTRNLQGFWWFGCHF